MLQFCAPALLADVFLLFRIRLVFLGIYMLVFPPPPPDTVTAAVMFPEEAHRFTLLVAVNVT